MRTFKTYIGIDLHKTTLTIGALDETKKEIGCKAIDTKCVEQIVDYVRSFPGPIACAIESVGMYEWLWELLEDKVDLLVLADAAEVKRRRPRGKAKTDRNDSLLLARLLVIDEVPVAYVPNKTTRSLRKLGRHYHTLSETLAEVKIRLRWILNQGNHRGPENITAASAQRWLLAQGEKLDEITTMIYKNYLSLIEKLETDKALVRREMMLIARKSENKTAFDIIQSIPGVGDIISFIVYAEIADFSRFPTANSIACYTGLTERTQESAGHRSPGRISKCGNPTLRWALVEAATTMIRHDTAQKAIYERIIENKGGPSALNRSKAKVAMAQRIIRYLWKMMQTGEYFRKSEPTTRQAELNAKRALKLVEKANVDKTAEDKSA
jgi:transposase